MSTDTLTINGSPVTLSNFNASIDRCVPIVRGGIPELHFSRILGPLTTLPDIWSAATVSLTVQSPPGTLIFTGDVVGYVDRYMDGIGWVREYRALGLRNRADYIPNTDSETLTDTSVFNLAGTDPNFIGSRAGLTVGQIVTLMLSGLESENAQQLYNHGIGQYISSSPWTLPSLTTNDLAALTVIPPWRVSISGERLLQNLENFVQTCHPNHWLHVQPDGTIRFLDARLATNNTITIGTDPRVGMPTLTRDYSDSYSQVTVRGNVLASPVIVQTQPWPGSSSSDGGLQEDFAWGTLTNAEAKAEWTPADFNQPFIVGSGGGANDTGSRVCTDTEHVVVTSNSTTATWPVNFWSQANAQGQAYFYADEIPGVDQLYAAQIVANTALTAGGTSTLTLDRPLPNTTFNSYQIWGLSEGESVVYRRYKVTNPNIAAAMLNFFPYPVPIFLAVSSDALSVTSVPCGFYQYYANGVNSSAGVNLSVGGITIDPVNGLIYFDRPTAVVNGTGFVAPTNVIAFLAVANGGLTTTAPQIDGVAGYQGTVYTVEGIKRTKILTVRDWTDITNSANMTTFASEYLDSVCDVVVEGTLPYLGILTDYLTVGASGQAISIAMEYGSTVVTTGYESLALPIVSVELVFNNGAQGTSYVTNLQLSNRRGRYTADAFLRPGIQTTQNLSGDVFGAAPSNALAFSGGPLSAPDPGSNLPAQWDGSMPGLGLSPEQLQGAENRATKAQQQAQDQAEQQGFRAMFGALPGDQGS